MDFFDRSWLFYTILSNLKCIVYTFFYCHLTCICWEGQMDRKWINSFIGKRKSLQSVLEVVHRMGFLERLSSFIWLPDWEKTDEVLEIQAPFCFAPEHTSTFLIVVWWSKIVFLLVLLLFLLPRKNTRPQNFIILHHHHAMPSVSLPRGNEVTPSCKILEYLRSSANSKGYLMLTRWW